VAGRAREAPGGPQEPGTLKANLSGADHPPVTQASESQPSGGGVHFVSVREAALRLGIGRSSLYVFVHSGDIHLVHPFGRRSVVAVVEIDRLAAKLAAQAGVVLQLPGDASAG
jgi:hypothetical protein